jgi:hypothetical protein
MVRRAYRLRSPALIALSLALSSLAAAACGGASSDAKSAANGAGAAGSAPPDVSIGDTALAQGGLDSLGGGSNRSGAQLAASSLRFDRLDKDSPLKMDGSLREWPARTAAKKVVSGDASKTAFAVGLQYDDGHIYVGGEVGDSGFVRSSRFADTEDHAVLTIAFPVGGSGGALAAYDVGLFAGEPGESAGVVRFASGARRGQGVPGAKIVEAPATGGYTFEVAIPWTAFPEGRTTRIGLRGAVRYIDSDGPNAVRAVIASGDGDAAHAAALTPLLTEPEQAVVEGLLVPKNLLGATPRFDLVADIAGDAMKERIAVYDQFLTICGPHYRTGTQFFYRDVGGEVVSLDAREITGRAKEDLVIQRKLDLGGATRQWFEVWSILGKTDEPQTTFGHEIAVVSGASHVTNSVHVSGRDVEIATEAATGWDVTSYREPTASDVEPVLLPWGPVKSQVYRFDGTKFAKVKEVAQQPAPGAPGGPSTSPPETFKSTLAEARAQEPATPDVSKGKDLSRDVFAQYRQDRGIAANAKPRVDLQVNVANDGRPERVLLVGRDIVVLGPGFKSGTGYAVLTLAQFASDDDVKDLSVRDLTGDGAADLVVRGVRHISAAGTHDPVDTESIFIYELDSEAITRVFAIETGREQKRKRVQGLVQFIPSDDHKSFEIDVRPGLARGWTKKTYPWAQDPPGGQMEPLLLPWGGVDDLRYVWDGAKFSPKP